MQCSIVTISKEGEYRIHHLPVASTPPFTSCKFVFHAILGTCVHFIKIARTAVPAETEYSHSLEGERVHISWPFICM